MRVGQKNKLTYRWAIKGSRPRAIHDQRTQSTYVFGAVCPELGTGAALVLPTCNTEAMQLHLNEIATKVTPGAHAILILDQAGWHGAKDLKAPGNISLLPLPPRSPELNPQENIWQFMRTNWLSNRVFKSFDDIVDHCCYVWNTLIDQPWKIMYRPPRLSTRRSLIVRVGISQVIGASGTPISTATERVKLIYIRKIGGKDRATTCFEMYGRRRAGDLTVLDSGILPSSGGSGKPYRNEIANPLRSAFTINPVCRPLSSRTAPFSLRSTIARTPSTTATPTPAAP
jgi:hypothetical protein